MDNIKIVDSHCDTLLKINNSEIDFFKDGETHLDLPKMIKSSIMLQFMAVYVDSIYKPGLSLRRSLELINDYLTIVEDPRLLHIKTKNDIETLSNKFPEKKGLLLALEGAEAIETIAILDIFAYLGMRCISLTWNHRNLLADGCSEQGGVTPFGKSVIGKMDTLGILCDVSHLSQKSFWDIIEITQKPILASHSNCYTLCPHPRNLTDEQIKELAKIDGVISITFYPDFIGLNKDLESIVRHISYVCDLVGVEHVGIGSDFDGADFSIKNLENAGKFSNLIKTLKKNGFHDNEIKKIMGNNLVELLKKTLPGGNYEC